MSAQAFDEALARFKKGLTPKEMADFAVTSIDDVHAEADRIQQEQAKRGSLRNMRRIQPYINGLSQFSKVIEVFIQAKPEIMSFIWGPTKFLLQVASSYTQSFDKLLDAFQKIGENLPRFKKYADIFHDNKQMQKVVSLIYEDILSFHRSTLKFFRMKAWRQIFTSLWRTFEDRFDMILSNLDRHKDLVDNEATAAHISAAYEARKASLRANKQNEKDRHIRQIRELKEWLAPVLYETKQVAFAHIRKKNPDAGNWLLEDDRFKTWVDPKVGKTQTPVLWLTGIPGSGKTILASLVMEHTKLLAQGCSVACAFLISGDPRNNSCAVIMRTLIYQLLIQNQHLLSHMSQAYESSNFDPPTSRDELEGFFQVMIGNTGVTYFIIDGLGEIEFMEGRSLLSSLLSIQSRNENLRIFLSSRSEVDISKTLKNVPQIKIGDANRTDIETYTAIEGRQLFEKLDLGFDARKEVEKMIGRVGSGACGMFLWVRLVIYNLMQQTSFEELELAASNLPKGLEEAYGRILERIDHQLGTNERDRARNILEWVTCATRPLKLREIEFALAIRVGDKGFVQKRKFLRRLDELCGPILEIHENGNVDFVHFSAKEYLISKYSGPFIQTSTAHFNIALTCVTYLSFTCFDDTLDDSQIIDCIYNGDYCLDDYAERNWLEHVQNAGNCSDGQLHDLSGALKSFIHRRRNARYQSLHTNKSTSYFAAFRRKHPQLYKDLVTNHAYQLYAISSSDSEHPLQLRSAIVRSRERFEKLVLSLQDPAEPDGGSRLQSIQNLYGFYPFKCHQRTCQHFYEGFETADDREKHTRQHIREFKCSVATCQFHSLGFTNDQALARHYKDHHQDITDVGAEAIPADIRKGPEDPTAFIPLLWDSIDTDNVILLERLLAQGQDIETKNRNGYTLLAYALSRGLKSHSTAVALLEKGASIEVLDRRLKSGKYTQTAIVIASRCPSYDADMIRLLIDKGATLSKAGSNQSPLMWAVINRSYEVVELILEKVGATPGEGLEMVFQGQEVLKKAWQIGFWEASKPLLLSGVRVAPTSSGLALIKAVEEEREEVWMILDHGTDSSSQYKALEIAIERESEGMVRMILDHGTDSSSQYKALEIAIKRESERMVRLILDHGISSSSQDKTLEIAIKRESERMVRVILNYRTDPPSQNKALEIAIEWESKRMVRVVMEHIGDDRTKERGLRKAIKRGSERIALVILEYITDKQKLEKMVLVLLENTTDERIRRRFLENVVNEGTKERALELAVKLQLERAVPMLLEYITDREFREKALELAVKLESERMVLVLLEYTTDEGVTERILENMAGYPSQETAFELAIEMRYERIARAILEHWAERHTQAKAANINLDMMVGVLFKRITDNETRSMALEVAIKWELKPVEQVLTNHMIGDWIAW